MLITVFTYTHTVINGSQFYIGYIHGFYPPPDEVGVGVGVLASPQMSVPSSLPRQDVRISFSGAELGNPCMDFFNF